MFSESMNPHIKKAPTTSQNRTCRDSRVDPFSINIFERKTLDDSRITKTSDAPEKNHNKGHRLEF